MKDYYIRTTHNFNNETREWDYRDLPEWKEKSNIIQETIQLTLGVHGVERDIWEPLFRIVQNNKDYIMQESNGAWICPENFDELVEQELKRLVKLDMVKCKQL